MDWDWSSPLTGGYILSLVDRRGIGGTGGKAGRVKRRDRSALGVAQGHAPRRDADDGSAGERRKVQHQGQHQQERHGHLPRARRALLRADPNQHVEGGAVVLLREQCTSGGMAPIEAIVRIPSGPRTGAHGLGAPRQSRGNGTAPLGRYQTHLTTANPASFEGRSASSADSVGGQLRIFSLDFARVMCVVSVAA